MELETSTTDQSETTSVVSFKRPGVYHSLGACFEVAESACLFADWMGQLLSEATFYVQWESRAAGSKETIIKRARILGRTAISKGVFLVFFDASSNLNVFVRCLPILRGKAEPSLEFFIRHPNRKPVLASAFWEEEGLIFFSSQVEGKEEATKFVGQPLFASDFGQSCTGNWPLGLVHSVELGMSIETAFKCMVFTENFKLQLFGALRASLLPSSLESNLASIQKSSFELLSSFTDPFLLGLKSPLNCFPQKVVKSHSVEKFIKKAQKVGKNQTSSFVSLLLRSIKPEDLFTDNGTEKLRSLLSEFDETQSEDSAGVIELLDLVTELVGKNYSPKEADAVYFSTGSLETNFVLKKQQTRLAEISCISPRELKEKTLQERVQQQVYRLQIVIHSQKEMESLAEILETSKIVDFKQLRSLDLEIKHGAPSGKTWDMESLNSLFARQFLKQSLTSLRLTVQGQNYKNTVSYISEICNGLFFLSRLEIVLKGEESGKTSVSALGEFFDTKPLYNFISTTESNEKKQFDYMSISIDKPKSIQVLNVKSFLSFIREAVSIKSFQLRLNLEELTLKDEGWESKERQPSFMKKFELLISFLKRKEIVSGASDKYGINNFFLQRLNETLGCLDLLETVFLELNDLKSENRKSPSNNIQIDDFGVTALFPFMPSGFLSAAKSLRLKLNNGKLDISDISLLAISSFLKQKSLQMCCLGFL